MGFTALIVQTIAGDIIDKTHFDRRAFLSLASVATAFSASAILFVHEGNSDHGLIFSTKIIEGIASSFIAPCIAALSESIMLFHICILGHNNFSNLFFYFKPLQRLDLSFLMRSWPVTSFGDMLVALSRPYWQVLQGTSCTRISNIVSW